MSRYRPAASYETILSTKHKFFKSSSRPKHNWHCIIAFLINPALLNVYLILHYHLFFRKELFFRMFIFQLKWYSNVFICFFWGGGELSKMRSAAYRRREFYASCVRKHSHYLFSCFWQHFCLIVSCFICRDLTLPLFKKDVFVRNGYFSPTRSVSVVMKSL